LLRWYNHIKSYGAKVTSFPGVKKSLEEPGFSDNGKKKEEDDDDFDPFGEEDEEEAAEAERLK
jgi:hypothetical protein